MKRFVVLYHEDVPATERVLQRLRSHFGQRRVVAAQQKLPSLKEGGIIVKLLGSSLEAPQPTGGGLPLDDASRRCTHLCF